MTRTRKAPRRWETALAVVAPLLFAADAASPEKENQVKQILQRMESDVLAFRDVMEGLAASRCDAATLAECSQSNYNDCSSSYPNQVCMKADELVVEACGDGTTCNALWSPTETAVRIPATMALGSLGNPTDPQVIEGVCYSRLAEQYMVENNHPGSQMYFGSAYGSFRIVPALHSEECGAYDPRRRPWFVAASSGPKDVVLIIDVSGSMQDFGRMDMAKKAATTIVDTLTVADRFSIVAFSQDATHIGGEGGLIRATRENKDRMIAEIGNLSAGGGTNFHSAFDLAFNAVDLTIENEDTSGCNVAVLFLTDGVITKGPGDEEVINLVNERVAEIATNHGQKTTVFTFSLGDKADHNATKTLACSTGGIWTAVDDFDDDLVSAMSSYYKLYALGLGEAGNEDWVAWVEPYPFWEGHRGTSVSAPVFDRSVHPPQFLGVVAIDMYMDALEELLGESDSVMLDRFVLLSTARCPTIEMTECEIDSLRLAGGGEEATCGACSNATSTNGFARTLTETCLDEGDLPNDFWANTDMLGLGYEERACCEIGGIVPADMCPLEDTTPSLQPSFQPSSVPSSQPSSRPSAKYIWSDDPDSSYSAGIIVAICVGNIAVLSLLLFLLKKTLLSDDSEYDADLGLPTSRVGVEPEDIEDRTFEKQCTETTCANETMISKREPRIEMSRLHSIDPPADRSELALPGQVIDDSGYTRQFSLDPPADEPVLMRDCHSSTISQHIMTPIAVSTSPFNPEYARASSNLSDFELEARLSNLKRHQAIPEFPPQSPASQNTDPISPAASKKKKSKIDVSCSVEPMDNDVLFDDDGATNTHPGNIKFHKKASELRSWYKESSISKERDVICDLLVESVTSEGNRFLEKADSGLWHEITESGARKKASRALRRKSSKSINVVV
ncbi:hypothetical protein ACHAWF_017729 [Thalassiosira exigua]